MKNILFFLLFSPIIGWSQIGIGTETPTRTLDINGDLRIRTTSATNRESAAKDSIITVGATGNITRVGSKTVIESHFKTFIKGGFPANGTSSITVSILANNTYSLIPFNTIDFDINSEFNTTTSTYTAKQSGIYSVYVSIRANPALLSLGNELGVGIFKNNILQAKNSFSNIQVVLANVSPPVRTVQTLLQLNTNDTITFKAFSGGIVNLGLLGNGEESFFTIQQVR